jgi:hypothetical protein
MSMLRWAPCANSARDRRLCQRADLDVHAQRSCSGLGAREIRSFRSPLRRSASFLGALRGEGYQDSAPHAVPGGAEGRR